MKKITLIITVLFASISFSQNFSLVNGVTFVGTTDGSTHLVDIDSDGDLDFFNTGDQGGSGFQGIAQLYTNNGTGTFTLVAGTPFPGVENASAEFADLDNDNDLDLILTGSISSGDRIANMYLNNGTGSFTLVNNTPFLGVSNGDVVIADLDNDNDLDVIISGYNTAATDRISVVYKNNGTGSFSLFTNSPAFESVDEGDVDLADVDGDGDLDALVTGDTGPGELSSLFLNNGNGIFTKDLIASALFQDLRDSDADIADIDGDGDKDILINGRFGTSDRVASLYINNGSGTFSLATGTPFIGANAGTVDFVDLDNDGDNDVILSGFENSTPNRRVRIYNNNGTGIFTEQTLETFTGINNADIAIGDINGDNKKDIIINGNSASSIVSEIYLNNTPLNTENFNNEIQVSVFPNPSTSYINIDSKKFIITNIDIIDVNGKIIKSQISNELSIDISFLSKGVYFMKIDIDNITYPVYKKIIKN